MGTRPVFEHAERPMGRLANLRMQLIEVVEADGAGTAGPGEHLERHAGQGERADDPDPVDVPDGETTIRIGPKDARVAEFPDPTDRNIGPGGQLIGTEAALAPSGSLPLQFPAILPRPRTRGVREACRG